MKAKDNPIEEKPQAGAPQGDSTQGSTPKDSTPQGDAGDDEVKAAEARIDKAIARIKEKVTEGDPLPSATTTLRKILGGDILSAQMVKSQVRLCLLVVAFIVVYIALRYQCQQDAVAISRLETELKDAKYKALSSSSALTERCRESRVLDMLQANEDSVLHIAEQPPYIINVPEE